LNENLDEMNFISTCIFILTSAHRLFGATVSYGYTSSDPVKQKTRTK